MRKVLFSLVIGLAGLAVLLYLGFWQLERLDWKEGKIAEAAAMMALPPEALPKDPDPVADRYRPAFAEGRFTGEELFVLSSTRDFGPGFLVIAAFETTDGRRILVDRGYIREADRATTRPAREARVTGNLNWPDDKTSATPEPDVAKNFWFARDVPHMSEVLGTEPVMLIAAEETGDQVMPMPATAAFRNDHLGYAVTWFGLAIVWLGMTGYWLWRIRARKD